MTSTPAPLFRLPPDQRAAIAPEDIGDTEGCILHLHGLAHRALALRHDACEEPSICTTDGSRHSLLYRLAVAVALVAEHDGIAAEELFQSAVRDASAATELAVEEARVLRGTTGMDGDHR